MDRWIYVDVNVFKDICIFRWNILKKIARYR